MNDPAATTRRSLLLVHSPLLGPSSLRPLAAVAASDGIEASVPDLTNTVHAPRDAWLRLVEAAVAAPPRAPMIVVGHSGAGVFLPLIQQRLESSAVGVVFVDAQIPPEGGVHTTRPDIGALLDSVTGKDGTMAKWIDWWSPEDIRSLGLQPHQEADLMADMPAVPRRFFDTPIPIPDGWPRSKFAYLRSSSAYEEQLAAARASGWKTRRLEGTHLSIYTQPDTVLSAILDLVGRA